MKKTATTPDVKKTVCPISKEAFLASGVNVTLQVKLADGSVRDLGALTPREFSTGSFGWYANVKTSVEVDGIPLAVQVGANLTVVGSKEAPATGSPAAKPSGKGKKKG